jgi:isopentenyldiphosphate isomerase
MVRRCRYEVGVDIIDITPIAPGFRYRETDPSGIVENEICPSLLHKSLRHWISIPRKSWSISGLKLMPSSALWLQPLGI